MTILDMVYVYNKQQSYHCWNKTTIEIVVGDLFHYKNHFVTIYYWNNHFKSSSPWISLCNYYWKEGAYISLFESGIHTCFDVLSGLLRFEREYSLLSEFQPPFFHVPYFVGQVKVVEPVVRPVLLPVHQGPKSKRNQGSESEVKIRNKSKLKCLYMYLYFPVPVITIRIIFVTYIVSPIHFINDANDVLWYCVSMIIIILNN